MAESEVSDWTHDDSSIGSDDSVRKCRSSSKRTVETWSEDLEAGEKEPPRKRRSCNWPLIRAIALGMMSTQFFTLFVFGAVVQRDQGLAWVLFYSLNAALPAMFLFYWSCCFPVVAIHALAMVNAMWSIIYLVTAALKVRETESIEETQSMYQETFTIQDTGKSQNGIIAMASIAFFSSMYHSIMAERLIDSKREHDHSRKDLDDDCSVEIFSDDEN